MITLDDQKEEEVRLAYNELFENEGMHLSKDIWKHCVLGETGRLEGPRLFRIGYIRAQGMKIKMVHQG